MLLMFIKLSSLQKSVSKCTRKKFYEIDPRNDPKGAPIVYAPAWPENIRLGWKGLPGPNTLANYKLDSYWIQKIYNI